MGIKMKYVINGRSPAPFFNFFEELCAIPHGSGNEGQIADYLCAFAKARNLEFYRDELNNVLIKKPAAAGYEDKGAVVLQAHVDMVCEKLPASVHDFTRDPLKLKANGDILSATDTTLGADDGAGVAAMLCALNDATLAAPALECLFTVSEETGMNGADGFDYTRISGRYLINLDNGAEGVACCGCAGGLETDILLPCETVPLDGKLMRVTVSGLAGGHSGVEINCGRRNAITLLASALLELYQSAPFCLVSIEGGTKYNVIPSTATAVISFFGAPEAKTAERSLRDYFAGKKVNFAKADKGFRYTFGSGADAANLGEKLTYRSTRTLLSLLASAPSGVRKYMPDDNSQVLSSVNLGILRPWDGGYKLSFFARSCDDNENEETRSILAGIATLAGGSLDILSFHPGWKYKRGGRLQTAYEKALKKVTGKNAYFENIHAGLECGIITAAFNKLDGAERTEAISIGPDMYDIHSAAERLDLASCSRFYAILSDLLTNL